MSYLLPKIDVLKKSKFYRISAVSDCTNNLIKPMQLGLFSLRVSPNKDEHF